MAKAKQPQIDPNRTPDHKVELLGFDGINLANLSLGHNITRQSVERALEAASVLMRQIYDAEGNEQYVNRIAAAITVIGRKNVADPIGRGHLIATGLLRSLHPGANDDLHELFLRKSAHRALEFANRFTGTPSNDYGDMRLLEGSAGFDPTRLHKFCGASVGYVNVGVAGPQPGHSRLLASVVAMDLAGWEGAREFDLTDRTYFGDAGDGGSRFAPFDDMGKFVLRNVQEGRLRDEVAKKD